MPAPLAPLLAPLLLAVPPATVPTVPDAAVPPLPAVVAAAPGAGDAVAGADGPCLQLLNEWEHASAGRTPVSAADRAAAAHARPGAPEELLALAAALSGPVDAGHLLARYRWRAVYEDRWCTYAPQVRFIEAAPADPLARVFTPVLRVDLARNDGPRAVTALAPGGPPQTLALPPLPAAAPRFARVDYSRVTRDEPRTPVRTALLTTDADRAPAWRLNRRVRPATDPRPRTPLLAPKP